MCLDTNLQLDFCYDQSRKMLVQLFHYTEIWRNEESHTAKQTVFSTWNDLEDFLCVIQQH